MACPYFYPVARLENGSWAVPPRVPLGDAYSGECRAAENAVQPEEERLRKFCNVGYGRGACEHFPQDAAADAVRFHIAGDSGGLIRIQYILERECWPGEHGTMECTADSRDVRGSEDAILCRQAAVFVESYLRRKT